MNNYCIFTHGVSNKPKSLNKEETSAPQETYMNSGNGAYMFYSVFWCSGSLHHSDSTAASSTVLHF